MRNVQLTVVHPETKQLRIIVISMQHYASNLSCNGSNLFFGNAQIASVTFPVTEPINYGA